jgi:hypothetical protein
MKFPTIHKVLKVYENRYLRLNHLNDIKSYDIDDEFYIDDAFDIKDENLNTNLR